MKMKILTGLILSLVTSTSFAAPAIYGEIDVSLDYLPENNRSGVSDKDVWEINSNSSFIGIKGEEKLNERLSVIYAAEWTFYADGDNTDFDQRNRFIGLKDIRLGTLKLGKHDTPLKQLSGVVDSFNNYVANKADVAGIFTGENRVDNVLVYESPAIPVGEGNLKINTLLATGEASGIKKSSGGVKTAGRGLGDAFSTAIIYDHQLFNAGIAYDKAIPSNFLGRGILNTSEPEPLSSGIFAAANTVRAVGRIHLNQPLYLKVLYQSSKVADAAGNATGAATIDDAQGWLIGAEYQLPQAQDWILKAQYSQNTTSFKNATPDYEAQQYMVGADYALNKQVKTYGYAGYLTLEQGESKNKQPLGGIGLEYKF